MACALAYVIFLQYLCGNFKEDVMNEHLIIIARARNGFTDKFGIPRQSREESQIETRVVFEPEFRNPDALRGIEGYSHLWLIWGFSTNSNNLTVRPPRLGGNTRIGVFATRSPFRPNPIGLTSVRLLRVENTTEGPVLAVSGADLLDGTPIYDIKPYLPYSDSHPEATNGFAEETIDYRLEVVFPEDDKPDIPAKITADLQEILSQDPRPAYQDNPERVYKMDYAGYNIRFSVREDKLYVLNITKSDTK